ncbi:CDP-alcohol phosphatidyltransferase family protein [Croceiramulus getboli]|nr:CDP-alcohol phosphatidyltransferase family protein [Flavobacteriaceae bacterium YJPT1-3]
MKLTQFVPNAFTLANLSCGVIATVLAVNGDLVTAAFFVFAGIFFDFFDGFFARILKAESEVGLQLDSLADLVTSGLAPSLVLVQLFRQAEGWTRSPELNITDLMHSGTWMPWLGFLVVLASAYRLAKFNVDTRQTTSFIGLPTPANALLILSLPLMLHYQYAPWMDDVLLNLWFLAGLSLLSAVLLNAEIALFALKFKHWAFRGNEVRYLFLIGAGVLLLALQYQAIPVIILAYVLVSLLTNSKETAEIAK